MNEWSQYVQRETQKKFYIDVGKWKLIVAVSMKILILNGN